MIDTSVFQSRKEKEAFLKQVINKLSVSDTEKEIYILSLEVLENADFSLFFQKILSQIPSGNKDLTPISLAPLTSTFL